MVCPPASAFSVELHRLQSSKFSIQRSAYQQRKHHRHPCHQYHHHHPFSATPHHHQLRLCHLSNPHPRMRQQGGGGVDRGSTTSSLLLAAGGSELATWCAEVVANVGATTTTGSPLPLPPSSRASSVPGLTVSGATNTTLSAAVVHHADSACQRVRQFLLEARIELDVRQHERRCTRVKKTWLDKDFRTDVSTPATGVQCVCLIRAYGDWSGPSRAHLPPGAWGVGVPKIVDPSQILNDRLLKLEWPSHSLLAKCLPQSACPLSSLMGAEGILVHRWTPSNIDPCKRSFCHRNIALITFPEGPITLEGHYVAIWEDLGLEYIPPLNA
ncbi:hypothetical protein EGR_09522 [Echinococcus granulosus]|uniref:Uncharacterized protein n=1 Tax=Echinococcus granulosus TaxID=6210 RepID=W6UAZ0_ECHGR|nr:hypothetical protein EGR_09522 [Echinococcus granulosus]EUB55627.1 hypothetical protein EGR_09522 [Echinococcus granulosus]